MTNKQGDRLLRLVEASAALAVSEATLRQWDHDGVLRVVRTPGGHRRVPYSEVERILKGKPIPEGDVHYFETTSSEFVRVPDTNVEVRVEEDTAYIKVLKAES